MRSLLAILILSATTTLSMAQSIPPGYNCTSDILGICDAGDGNQPEPAPAPAPDPAPADPPDDGDTDLAV